MWAAIAVFAEVADDIIKTVRAREDEWLAALRSRLGPAQEKRAEAARLLDEARAEEWYIHKLGQWLQVNADDGPLGRQPHPVVGPPPKEFDAETARSMLERPWHQRREEERPTSWQEQPGAPDVTSAPVDVEPEPPEDPDGDGDPTGQVSELDPSVA